MHKKGWKKKFCSCFFAKVTMWRVVVEEQLKQTSETAIRPSPTTNSLYYIQYRCLSNTNALLQSSDKWHCSYQYISTRNEGRLRVCTLILLSPLVNTLTVHLCHNTFSSCRVDEEDGEYMWTFSIRPNVNQQNKHIHLKFPRIAWWAPPQVKRCTQCRAYCYSNIYSNLGRFTVMEMCRSNVMFRMLQWKATATQVLMGTSFPTWPSCSTEVCIVVLPVQPTDTQIQPWGEMINERWAAHPRASTPLPAPSDLQPSNFNTFINKYSFHC